ncbi:hypothetical protein KFK09_014878 [Dendrobium nobile]|uniref:Uncharacterized protein n=1 Tax=Dendrobium nobile TaxID=94219 RepID=A0A8T3B4A9_DENNO|nr:hypothetical protein KFK09_014878 [Dendrobium nobile]
MRLRPKWFPRAASRNRFSLGFVLLCVLGRKIRGVNSMRLNEGDKVASMNIIPFGMRKDFPRASDIPGSRERWILSNKGGFWMPYNVQLSFVLQQIILQCYGRSSMFWSVCGRRSELKLALYFLYGVLVIVIL